MVLGYHLVLSAYGFWLPNDPRGSYSKFVGSEDIFRFGKATTVDTRVSVAAKSHDFALRRRAKQALERQPVRFNGSQARAVGRGFASTVEQFALPIWACAIMTDHAHLVIGRHELSVEEAADRLKRQATKRLLTESLHPFSGDRDQYGRLPSVWARGDWKVYLSSQAAIEQAIRYVEQNPIKAGLRAQRWSFVCPYDG